MKQNKILVAVLSLVLAACSRDGDAEPETLPPDPPTGTAPVETNPPNASYRPAFAGQTRVAGVTTSAAYRTTIVTSSLTSPWGVTSLPDGRLLVTEKAGRMRIVSISGSVSGPITGLLPVNAAGQGGLLGLCLDPDFSSNKLVYWSFSGASKPVPQCGWKVSGA